MKYFRLAFALLLLASPAKAASVITATITFTNAANLTNSVAISNALLTVNSDTRTYTNSIFDPATQIRIATNVGTNIAQQVQQTLVHVATHPFAGLRPFSDGATYISLRGTNDQAVEVILAGTNFASVSYSTQTVTSATSVRVPFTVESEITRTNVASGLAEAINSAYNTNGILGSKIVGTVTPAAGFGIHGKVISTNYTATTDDLYIGVHSTTGAVTITFPSAASASNLTFWIKDEGGNAATTNITLQLQDGDRIDGATNGIIATDYGGLIVMSRGFTNWFIIPTATSAGSIGITIDGGGSAISTGIKGYLEIPYDCTILQATMLADVSGSAVVDIWKDTFANYPPTVADTITASAKPTLSGAISSQDTTLTGWTKTISAGDILAFKVDSAATITRLTLTLKVRK